MPVDPECQLEVNLVETLSAGRPSENLSCEKVQNGVWTCVAITSFSYHTQICIALAGLYIRGRNLHVCVPQHKVQRMQSSCRVCTVRPPMPASCPNSMRTIIACSTAVAEWPRSTTSTSTAIVLRVQRVRPVLLRLVLLVLLVLAVLLALLALLVN